MRTVLTRLGAVTAALMSFLVVFGINLIGSTMLASALRSEPWLRATENYPLVAGYQTIGSLFLWGYPVCVAISTASVFWNGWPRERGRLVLYLLLLGVVGPLTFINYLASDQWLNLWVQTAFNLFVAFVGYTAVLKIRAQPAASFDAKAIQSLSVLGITSLLVALPLFYSAIFLAVAFGLIDHRAVQSLGDNVPLAIAGGAGTVAVFLANLDELRGVSTKAGKT